MRKQVKAVKRTKGEPKFVYMSACCSERASKEPCVKVDKKTALTQGLGKFRCPKCRKRCKVTRSKM